MKAVLSTHISSPSLSKRGGIKGGELDYLIEKTAPIAGMAGDNIYKSWGKF
jgi:hypothetical protein